MRRHPLRILRFVLFGVVAVAALGLAVMLLWNWIAPSVFGLRSIEYLQAVGLLVLARILFGALRGRGACGGRWRGRMMERWAQMSPEERERFRAGLSAGPCGFGAPGDVKESR
jgi:hypothetical protein